MRIAVASLALVACFCGRGFAESGAVHTSVGAGLRISLDTRWASCGPGYRPVTIGIVPTAPVTADRTLTIEFVVKRYGLGKRLEDRTIKYVEVPAGSGPIHTTLSLPDVLDWDSYEMHVLENGNLLVPLSISGADRSTWSGAHGLEAPAVLIAGNAPLGNIYSPYSSTKADWNADDTLLKSALNKLATTSDLFRLEIEAFPHRWIDYSSLDLVVISLDELDELKDRNPEAFDAVMQWTAAGGNLIVYDVGPNFRRLGKLESLVRLTPCGVEEDDESGVRGWSLPDKELFAAPPPGFGLESLISIQEDVVRAAKDAEDTSEQAAKSKSKPPVPPDEPPFVTRPFQQGMVVAVVSAKSFQDSILEWGWLMGTLGAKRVLWTQRHGVSTSRPNSDYWDFLIPGVGLVPVTGFRLLITLFVIAIGPMNYFLLRRLKRLHLLILTTPLSAVAVTGLLFGYAVVTDGFGTQVRVRNATHIDQRQGRAVAWTRLSYYAGLTPRRGLAFPNDVTVTPIEYMPGESRPRVREVVWEGDQRFTEGWLAARTPTQFLTVRARPSKIGIDVGEPEDSGADRVELTNRLATRVERLLLRTRDGRYWWAADVADGEVAQAVPIDVTAGFRRLEEAERGERPACPPDMDVELLDNCGDLFGSRRYRRWYYRTGEEKPTQATGRLEQAISLLRSGATGKAVLEPGSYLAIVERSPEVVLGIPAAREVGGFHLVHGTW